MKFKVSAQKGIEPRAGRLDPSIDTFVMTTELLWEYTDIHHAEAASQKWSGDGTAAAFLS